MCHNYAKHLLIPTGITISLFSTFITAKAQNSNKENAPYSRYGLGEQRNPLNTVLKGMGNISAAYADGYNINTDNPASYATLKLVTYEAGAEGGIRTIITNNQSFGSGSATLSYLTIGVPLGKHAGLAIGLRPNSRVYYWMNDSLILDGVGPAVKGYSGDGSTNYGFIGLAGTYGGFSLGANVGYLFGTIRNSLLLMKQYDTVNAYNSDFSTYTKIGGLYYKLGAQYEAKLNAKIGIRVGATAALSQTINVSRDIYRIAWRRSGSINLYDTAYHENNVKGEVVLPLSFSGGVQVFEEEKWLAGLDFSAANWSQFRNFGLVDSTDNSFRIGVGGAFTPNAASLYQYIQRVTYRLGFYYGKDFVRLRNTDINFYAVTVGASLPFKRAQDRLHLGFEIGRRGTESSGLVQENFYRFSLGISLNDKWFVKRRYD